MSQSHQLPNVEIDPRTLDLWCLEYLFHVGAMSSDHVVERIEELFSSSLDARRDNVNRNDGTRSAENESLDALAAAEDARNWSYKLGVIKNVLSWVMDGNIEKALEAIRRDAPEILKNQRLGFLLHKQQFTELVRTANGDPSSIQEAITYLQTHLAQNDLASSAYPKEYAQLKRAMLMLLFQPRPGSKEIDVRGGGATPIDEWLGNEWSLDSREQLAGMLRKGLLQYFGIGEPKLSLLLRYLTLSHNMFYILYANGDQSPVQQYSDFFLISHDGVDNDDLDLDFPEEKGKAVGSADSCSSSISDREISVLAQSAGISPQKARSSLTRAASQLLQGHSQMSVDEPDTAGGESAMFMMLWKQDPRGFSGLEIAMKAEVSRMRIGHTQLIDLVKSYCQRRGLLSPEEVMPLDKSLNLLDVRRSQHIRC
ncbi:CTLH/CRA C-terminal to lish motif domain-containing protein [Cladochytrium replicatum]|nr:CTLH/CRA C-terminal to lish motif domain-containing protein [Cladochytrium replicatum]